MESYPLIKDLIIVDNPNYETRYYFTDNMLGNGVFIEEDTLIYQEKIGTKEAVETIINVKVLSEKNAETFTLYHDFLLEKIQLHHILKDICDFYNNNDIKQFVETMNFLCSSYHSSKMQSNAERRMNIRAELKEEIKFLQNCN